MELSVVECRGVPETAILSIRAGSTRRQAKLSDVDRPFKFPSMTGSEALKVDVFAQLGTARAICPEDGTFLLQLDPVQAVGGGVKSAMELKLRMSRPDLDGARLEKSNPSSIKQETLTDAEQYLEEHNMLSFLQYIVQGLIREKPQDAYSFVAKQFVAYKGDNSKEEEESNRGSPNRKVANDGAAVSEEELQTLRQQVSALQSELAAKDKELQAIAFERDLVIQERDSLKATVASHDTEIMDFNRHLDAAVADPESSEVDKVREMARQALTRGAQNGDLVKALVTSKTNASLEEEDQNDTVERLRQQAQDAFSRGAVNGRLEEALRRMRGLPPSLPAVSDLTSRSDGAGQIEGLLAEVTERMGTDANEEDSSTVKGLVAENQRLALEVQAMRTRIESVRPDTEALREQMYKEMHAAPVEDDG